MASINVSTDAKGNLTCGDIDGTLGESVTWVIDTSTVRSIDSITPSVGSFNPAPTARNGWTGTLYTDGNLPGGGTGIVYTISATTSNGSQKQKSPKVTVNPPFPTNKKSKRAHLAGH